MSLTSIAFLIAFFGGLLASLLRNPAYGLYTYIAVFYLHPPDRWWGEMLPDLRWSLLAAFVTLISLWRVSPIPDRPSWLQNNAAAIFLVFVGWFWIQLAWALDTNMQLEAAVLFTKYALLVYLIYVIVRTEDIFRNVLLVHVLGCLFLAWIIFVTPESGRLDGRFDGVGGPGIDDANSLAMQLSTGLLAASALLLRSSLRIRLIALAASPLIVNGIIQTLSRGSVLGLVAGGLVMLLYAPQHFRRAYYALGLLGLLILLQMAPAKFWERVASIADPTRSEQVVEVDKSTLARFALAESQLEMAIDYPFGAGHRGTADLSPRYLSEEYLAKSESGEALGTRSSHNTFLSVLVEHGVFGALLFICLLVSAFRQLRQLRELDAAGLPEALGLYRATIAGTIASVLIAGIFTDYLKAEVFVWFLGLLAALYELSPRALQTPAPVEPPEPEELLEAPRRRARR